MYVQENTSFFQICPCYSRMCLSLSELCTGHSSPPTLWDHSEYAREMQTSGMWGCQGFSRWKGQGHTLDICHYSRLFINLKSSNFNVERLKDRHVCCHLEKQGPAFFNVPRQPRWFIKQSQGMEEARPFHKSCHCFCCFDLKHGPNSDYHYTHQNFLLPFFVSDMQQEPNSPTRDRTHIPGIEGAKS